LSEKSRPSSHVVINSLFHLTIDSSPKQYPRERSGSFSPVHPHPRRIISGWGTYYGKSLPLPFYFLPLILTSLLVSSLTSFQLWCFYLQDVVHQDQLFCCYNMHYCVYCRYIYILQILDLHFLQKEKNPLLFFTLFLLHLFCDNINLSMLFFSILY